MRSPVSHPPLVPKIILQFCLEIVLCGQGMLKTNANPVQVYKTMLFTHECQQL